MSQWRFAIALLGFFVAQTWQVLNWDIGPDQLNLVYQLPADGVVAAMVGVGGALIVVACERVIPSSRGRAVVTILLGLAFTVLLVNRAVAVRERQVADAVRPINHDRSVLAAGFAARRIVGGGLARVESDAIVVGDWEQVTVGWYRQFIEGAPAIQMYYPVTNLRAALADHPSRPVWLAARTDVPANRRLSMDGPFIRVRTTADVRKAVPSGAVSASHRFDDAIELVGFEWSDRAGLRSPEYDAAADVLAVTLYWRALGMQRGDLSISLRLVDGAGRTVAQQDNAAPVLSLYPTSRWAPDEIVGDYYELPFRSLPPGEYRVHLRVYEVRADAFRDLRVGTADFAEVAIVRR
jgi:hypothetical protein